MKKQVYKANLQNGSVLIISLIIMVVLTILGVSGMKTSLLEEKMAGNLKDSQLAFQAAEATLKQAEQFIDDNVVSIVNFDDDGTDGLYDTSTPKIWETINWDDNDSIANSGFGTDYSINTPPRFIVQHLVSQQSDVDDLNLDNYGQGTGAGRVEMFLITARATGSSGNSVVTLQSTYGKRL